MSGASGAGFTASSRATLRLQLHAGYTLDDARADLYYFARLGVSHLYLSPVSQSSPGSTHGYDVVDHGRVDAARGGEPALRRLAEAARHAGMGILLDIVPNHMATDPANAWWWDVLAHGRRSFWADWFDIDWDAPAWPGKVLAPFLQKPYAEALRAGDICLRHDAALGLHVAAQGQPYPLAPETLAVLGIEGMIAGRPMNPAAIDACLAAHDPGRSEGRRRLHHLLSSQHYRLAGWRRAADAINWRRFFEVSGLIGVRVEDDAVFDAVHALPLRLYAEGLIDGLRIDHVDGLAQPLAYCRRLRAAMRALSPRRPAALRTSPPWLVVEKILAPGEALDERWAVSGTTGYDFAADVGAVLHDGKGEDRLFKGWAKLSGDARPPQAWLLQARQEMLDRHFMAERNGLLGALERLVRSHQPDTQGGDRQDEDGRGVAGTVSQGRRPVLARALDALLRHYPTYRSYVEDEPRGAADQYWFDQALRGAAAQLGARPGTAEGQALRMLDGWFGRTAPLSNEVRLALRRFQQLTPPLAAKSLEDTVFYRYGCLLSRNEVGSDPAVFALSVDAFHERNLRRARGAPDGLLATATHDHKRGEDARARLAVLSEIPDQWLQACQGWLDADQSCIPDGDVAAAFHYMLLQTLVGAWPPGLSADDPDGVRHFLDRIGAWTIKALREGKQLSSWFEPQAAQETAWLAYLEGMAPGGPSHAVLCGMAAFVHRIEPGAIANGLIQTALRMTCPGIPDLYQGTEWRDFSLVDPDNRRTVDFQARARSLSEAAQRHSGARLWRPPLAAGRWPAQAWSDGRVKQVLIAVLLALRGECAAAFSGDYRPLAVHGACADRLLAFSRGDNIIVVAGVKCAARLRAGEGGMPVLPEGYWEDAVLPLQGGCPVWRDVLRGRTLQPVNGQAPVAGLLAGFPLAVLRSDQG